MSVIERKPSFFRVGGLQLVDQQHLTAGKNQDGSFYLDIKGGTHARAILTPEQTFNLCRGLLRVMGYVPDKLESMGPPQ